MTEINNPPFFLCRPKSLIFRSVDLNRGWSEARERIPEIPNAAGLYVLVRPATAHTLLPSAVYVGRSEQLRTRWVQHLNADTTRLLPGTRSSAGHEQPGAVLHQTYMNEFLRRDMGLWLWSTARPEEQEALFIRAHVRAHAHRPLHNNTIPDVGGDFVLRHLDAATEWMASNFAGLM